jgi:hypothetical protein
MPKKQEHRDHITEILSELTDAGVAFIIAGGVAAVLHGVERLTLDIDLAIKLTPENIDRFWRAAKKLKLVPRVPITPEILGNPESVRRIVEEKGAIVISFIDPDKPYRHLDIFLRDDLSYEKLLPETKQVTIGGRNMCIVSIERLLKIKEAISTPREKDLLDIRVLRRLLEDHQA